MPPQKYWMSGPFFAWAAALKAGTRPFVVWRTVLIVTFGCFFSYSAIVWASHSLAPAASCSPHHHIVRFTFPFGKACGDCVVPPNPTPAAASAATAPPSARMCTAFLIRSPPRFGAFFDDRTPMELVPL